jgi:glycosyltransferase involved in cell wall biosynthesis
MILVGVPVYKDGPMVDRCLRSLEEEPGVQLLIVDNGSDPDVKQVIAGRPGVIRNDVNRYVNPAWNQIMEAFLESAPHDLLVLANSDLVLDPGWAEKLREHRSTHPSAQIIFGVDAPRQRRSAGTFFAMTRYAAMAIYPIPDDLLVMGGDDFIFYVNLGVGHEEHIVPSITMTHVERGTYDKAPEIWGIAREDTGRWNRYVLRDLVTHRIQKFLSLATIGTLHEHLRTLYTCHLDACSVCDRDDFCMACATGLVTGHACNCPEELGGGRGYRISKLWEIAHRKMLLSEHRANRAKIDG